MKTAKRAYGIVFSSLLTVCLYLVLTTFVVRAEVVDKGIKTPELRSVTDCGDYELVEWKRPGRGADGVQIQCSMTRSFKICEQTITVVDRKVTSTQIDGLKKKNTYYVRIRALRLVRGDYVYSKWSSHLKFVFGDEVSGIQITNNPETMVVGRSFSLKAQITPDGLQGRSITWKSSNKKVATVDETGNVTALHSGKTKITASCDGKKDICTIKVNIKGIITIIDDDGSRKFMTKIMPIVRNKRVSISAAVVPGWTGKKSNVMTWDEIERCHEEGAEILCHTLRHHTTDETNAMTEKEIEAEYSKAKEIMEKHGYNGDILVYSRSTGRVPKAEKAASKVFKCAIDSNGYRINTRDNDMFLLKRYKFDYYARSPKMLRQWVDEVDRNGGWMIWMIHCGTDRVNGKAVKNLGKVIDYARKRGVDIVTAQEGYEMLTKN